MAYLLLLTVLAPFHSYFFYSFYLLWKKGTDKLSWHHGFYFSISGNVVVHFWIQFFKYL
jgi:hypothetical protein